MKVIVRVYDGGLSSGAKEGLIEAMEEDGLLLTGELSMPASTPEIHPYYELTFEEEPADAEEDVPEEEPS
ncbi:hypothetical protein LCGC14_0460740 [marine sediment metagenome]|uniref:Uncharacterized protein n=1 Tax=marine sediment metagenome TaxID=412755 RepID=A0A0F9SXX3_9ZZZZ|nr:hypothetical protein [bacterium]